MSTDGDNILERGDRGDAVTELQRRLSAFGYYSEGNDGVFGGALELSVMDFQRDAKIQIDGRAGPQTIKSLGSWNIEKTENAKVEGRTRVVYVNQHAVRNRPVTPFLEATLAAAMLAVYGNGYEAQIYSGGQVRKGMPGKRTGSIRHDDYGEGGRALDAYILDQKGKKLEGMDLALLGQYWLANNFGGCGVEMAVGGIHLDEWQTPPPGGGKCWFYPYTDTKPWAEKVRNMLA